MKFLRTILVLAIAPAACLGDIGDGTKGPPSPEGPPTNPPPVAVGACSEATLARPRVWRLTNLQIKNTLRDALGAAPPTVDQLPDLNRLDGYANRADNLPIDGLLADQYFKISEELADDVARRAADFVKCPQGMAGLGTGTCMKDFLSSFALKLWRRPPTDAEVAALTALYGKTAQDGGDPAFGFKSVVQAIFMSPSFLYRSELGHTQNAGEVTYLTDYELASALSYTLWDTAPDAALLDLARQGKLRDKKVLTEQAMRLLGSADRASPSFYNFVQQWLYTEDLLEKDKDPEIFSVYNRDVAADLSEEAHLYLNSVVFDPGADRSFKSLFTNSYGFVSARTAPLYGVTASGTKPTKTSFNPAERRGLLTLASFMAAHADPDGTALVDRGRYFREEILCAPVPPPPDGAAPPLDPKFATADMTGREKFTQHSENPQCGVCHQLFDGLGFAMESYDAIGRYRTTDKGKQLDPSGQVPLPSGVTIKFDNFVDLVDQLSKTKDLYSCFSSQYLTYATGRKLSEVKECERELVSNEFERSGYKLDSLIMSVVNTPSFMARKN